MEVHVVHVPWESHDKALQEVRAKVFIEEQGVARDVEWDGQDDTAEHFLAINEAGQSIGCARLLPSGQIGRMAVLAEHRGSGIGFRLLQTAVEHAKESGFQKVFLHAQTHAESFYRRGGFLPAGDEFMEAGIPHQNMEMELPIAFEAVADVERPAILKAAPDPASEHAELLQHDGEPACRRGIVEGVQWANRTIRIYSQYLDHVLFDDQAVVDALSSFVRRGPPATLKILVHTTNLVISRGHRLLELARRLDSKIEIRLVPGELAEDSHSCVILDELAFLMLPDYRDYKAFSNRYDPAQADKLAARFDYLWRRSASDPELRALRL